MRFELIADHLHEVFTVNLLLQQLYLLYYATPFKDVKIETLQSTITSQGSYYDGKLHKTV